MSASKDKAPLPEELQRNMRLTGTRARDRYDALALAVNMMIQARGDVTPMRGGDAGGASGAAAPSSTPKSASLPGFAPPEPDDGPVESAVFVSPDWAEDEGAATFRYRVSDSAKELLVTSVAAGEDVVFHGTCGEDTCSCAVSLARYTVEGGSDVSSWLAPLWNNARASELESRLKSELFDPLLGPSPSEVAAECEKRRQEEREHQRQAMEERRRIFWVESRRRKINDPVFQGFAPPERPGRSGFDVDLEPGGGAFLGGAGNVVGPDHPLFGGGGNFRGGGGNFGGLPRIDPIFPDLEGPGGMPPPDSDDWGDLERPPPDSGSLDPYTGSRRGRGRGRRGPKFP